MQNQTAELPSCLRCLARDPSDSDNPVPGTKDSPVAEHRFPDGFHISLLLELALLCDSYPIFCHGLLSHRRAVMAAEVNFFTVVPPLFGRSTRQAFGRPSAGETSRLPVELELDHPIVGD